MRRFVICCVLVLASAAHALPITIAPDPFTFLEQPTGTETTKTVVASHAAGPPHIIDNITKTGDCSAYTITGINGFTVDATGTLSPTHSIGGTTESEFIAIKFKPMTVQPTFNCLVELKDGGTAQVAFQVFGSSTGPEIAVTPLPELDIGNVALGNMGMGTVTIANSGNAMLAYTFVIDAAGLAAGFSTTDCATQCTLQPGSTPHTIYFSPQSAGAKTGHLTITSNDANEAAIVVDLAATGMASSTGAIAMADTNTLAFGKVAVGSTKTRHVTISNTGTGALSITSTTFGDAVFGSSSQFPLSIPANTSEMVAITCTPVARTIYSSTGTIRTTADNGNLGLGVSCIGAPEVTVTDTIDFGVVAAGTSLRLDDAIDIHNIAASASFVVSDVKLVDDTGGFGIDVTSTSLAPGARIRGDATFTPPRSGAYEARIDVFLDGDPEVHGVIVLTGHAVELEPTGGCSTGRGAAFPMIFVVLAFFVRRRLGVVALLLVASQARADVDMQTYRPSPSVGEELFQIDSASIAPTSWTLGVALAYAREPLRLGVDCGGDCPMGVTESTTSLVRSQVLASLGGALAYKRRFEVGVSVPLLVQSGADSQFASAVDGAALGEIAAHGKIALLHRGSIALAASTVVTAPTASEGAYAGSGLPTARIAALVTWEHAPLTLAFDAGALVREQAMLGSLRQGSEVDGGLGVAYRVHDRVTLTGEAFGSFGLVEGSQSALQTLAGARIRVSPDVIAGVAGGVAIVAGAGVPSVRGIVVVTYAPSPRAEPKKLVTIAPTPTPTPPTPTTTVDPDPDRDGVVDPVDRCVSVAEDKDGFEDSDGCPDPDNDGDSVADADDRCPTVAGPIDGCPDDDRDHDGVADASDRCPDQVETINGNTDDDGCPDAGDSLVLVGKSRIDLFDPIRFAGDAATIAPASANVLAQLAQALRADRAIVRVTITVHVRARTNGDADRALSLQRATAVVDALAARGVNKSRLEAIGLGTDKPLPGAAPGAAVHDRIELSITRR